MSELKSERAKKLQAISKRFLILKDQLNLCDVDRFEIAGQCIAETFEIGAFNRPEHFALRIDARRRLSQKDYIGGWDDFRVWSKYGKPPFPPSDHITTNYSADFERAAKAILEEAKAIEQADLAGEQEKDTGINAGRKGKPHVTQQEVNTQLRAIFEREQKNIQQTGRLPKMSDVAKEIGCSVGLLYNCSFMKTIKVMRQGLKKDRKPKESRLKNEILYVRPDDKTIDPAKEAEENEIARLLAESKADEVEQNNRRKKLSQEKQEQRTGDIVED
jgi:hypothetical protein